MTTDHNFDSPPAAARVAQRLAGVEPFHVLELAARAGYDPRAAANVWRKMSQLGAQSGNAQPPQFLSTHPAHATRIREIEANLPKVMPLYEAARRAGETR